MAIETERKFLVNGTPLDLTGWDHEWIEQGYLVLDKKNGKQVRVRKSSTLRFDGRTNVAYTIAYKQDIAAGVRVEIEAPQNPIPGKELLEACEYKLTKERWSGYFIDGQGPYQYSGGSTHHVAIDLYPDGLRIVEVEYLGEDKEWTHSACGKEVTGDKKYSNIQIAINNEKSISPK